MSNGQKRIRSNCCAVYRCKHLIGLCHVVGPCDWSVLCCSQFHTQTHTHTMCGRCKWRDAFGIMHTAVSPGFPPRWSQCNPNTWHGTGWRWWYDTTCPFSISVASAISIADEIYPTSTNFETGSHTNPATAQECFHYLADNSPGDAPVRRQILRTVHNEPDYNNIDRQNSHHPFGACRNECVGGRIHNTWLIAFFWAIVRCGAD